MKPPKIPYAIFDDAVFQLKEKVVVREEAMIGV